ncbi:MAG TPA: hypothetical protein VHZ78_00430 [Rhizomicrobium sp.]|jgi:hypothetical protein|nr:hypothetical protein [Rhizomicrobium sp.]
MHTLRLSFLAGLASTFVFTLSFPFLIFLYRMGGNFWHMFPERTVYFIYQSAYIEEGSSTYFVNWVAFVILFGIPTAVLGLGERWVLNRIARTDYLACALLCGFCAPLVLLIGVVGFAAMARGAVAPGWFGLWVRTILASICWLAPFGVAQGIVYRAIAGVTIGKPPLVAAVAN